ncbi:Hsp70 family protein [Streptomyces sp. NPDC048483]|uniref:Hsp70 family protein n=1 Tax=Streptomyces sp. NPDC048483 TaxID=3154927 RepID=UPI003437DD71
MSTLGIDLGHRYGRIGWPGPDGQPVVAPAAALNSPEDMGSSLAELLALAPDAEADGPAREVALGLSPSGGQELALRRAARSAGLDVLHAVPDPVAVALHYGTIADGVESTVLVCDQGATTLELTALAISGDRTVRITDTTTHPLGGDHWDAAVAGELLRQITTAHPGAAEDVRPDAALYRVAEELRLGIGDGETRTRQLNWQDLDCEVALDRVEFERLVTPLRRRAREAVAAAVSAGDERPGGAPTALLLAGGLCATEGLAEALEDGLGLYVRCAEPASAVVRGLVQLSGFGVLRVLSGRQAQEPPRHEARSGPASGRRPDPEPPRDPEPRQEREAPQDPEPQQERERRQAPESVVAAEPAPATPPEAGPTPRHEPQPPEPEQEPVREPEPRLDEPVPEPEQGPEPDTETAPTPPPTTDNAALAAVPVDHLQAIRRDDHLLVLWAWPDDCLAARVRWRVEGDRPTSPLDSGDVRCSRRVYEHDGGLDLVVGRGAVTLTVEALVAGGQVGCEGAAALLVPAESPVVRYTPAVRRTLKGRIATVTFETDTHCELPALRIVHGTGRYRPMSTKDGTVVHEVAARPLRAGTPASVEFAFPAGRGPSWLVCFPVLADRDAETPEVRPAALHRLKVT